MTTSSASRIAETRNRVEGLREILRGAVRGGLGAPLPPELGSRLRIAADRVIAVLDGAPDIAIWRAELADFEGLEPDAQAVAVARGQRLCFTLSNAVGRGVVDRRGGEEGEGVRAPARSIPGIGPALAERLAERGLETVEDLVWLVPRRYDDARRVQPLAAAVAEVLAQATGEPRAIAGEVASSRFSRNGRRRWVEVRVVDPEAAARASVLVRWFNAHGGMAARFPKGSRVVLSGKLSVRGNQVEMANPDVLAVETPDGAERRAPGRILPRYPDVPGVAPGILR